MLSLGKFKYVLNYCWNWNGCVLYDTLNNLTVYEYALIAQILSFSIKYVIPTNIELFEEQYGMFQK